MFKPLIPSARQAAFTGKPWLASAHAFFALLFVLILTAATGCAEEAERHSFSILSKNGTEHRFQVELAVTPSEQERGLMFRTDLGEQHGMLFLYNTPQPGLSFWMKNTYIPLDLLFIGPDQQIVFIHENAKPLSEDLITTPVPAVAVLEIKGGLVKKLGINVGDQLMMR